jgi:DinB family protein
MTPDQRALRDALAAVPSRLAVAIPVAQPAPAGEWAPREVLLHLLAVEEQVWQPRLQQLATEPEPHWPWFEPGLADLEAESWEAVHEAFAASRRETIAMLDALGDAGWAKSGVHERFGRLDVPALVERAIDHDEEHIASFAV